MIGFLIGSIEENVRIMVILSSPGPALCPSIGEKVQPLGFVNIASHWVLGFPGGSVVKNPPAKQQTWVNPQVGKVPWRRKWQRTPVFLPGRVPWTDEPGGLWSMGLQRFVHGLVTAQP